MFRRATLIAGRSIVSAVLALALGASSAMAATFPAADVGGNVGKWLSGLGGDLLIPTAGLFGIAALFRRDVGHALTIALIAVIVGIFVYDGPNAEHMITSLANQFIGTSTK